MRYMFFTNTPAHVHMYKHPVRRLADRGHDVLILARRYGCTEALLKYYDLPYEIYGKCDTTKYSLFKELPIHYKNIFYRARQYDPDVIFGMGAYSAHAGAMTGAPAIAVLDSEPTDLDHTVSRPFVDAFLTPHVFGKDLGANHYRFRGFKECAYLHPDIYEPDGEVRDRLGIGPDDKYALIRFNAFGSHHDVGKRGFTRDQRRHLVEAIGEHATVFVSDEGGEMDLDSLPARKFDLHPALLHDALAGADLLVADTQTMVTEAALLGTPAIRSNSFVGESDMGNFLELERNDLVYNVADFETVLERSREILRDDSIQETWERRRDEYMSDKINLTDLIVDIATHKGRHPESPARNGLEDVLHDYHGVNA